MDFTTLHPGPIIMLAALLLALVLLLCSNILVRTFLPKGHWLRHRVEGLTRWAQENPELAGKRIRQIVFALVLIAFSAITFVYS